MDPALIPDAITFSALLTAVGAGIGAALVTSVVAVLRAIPPLAPWIDRVTGALVAFVLSAILYVLAGISVGVDSLDEGLAVFVAWLTCATAAVGVNQVVARRALVK